MIPKSISFSGIGILVSLVVAIQLFVVFVDSHYHHHHGHHHRKPQQYLRPCYFTNWAGSRSGRAKYTPEDYVPGLCTHIIYAFAGMEANYTASSTDSVDLPSADGTPGLYARVNALKAYQPGLKTLLSFGGGGFARSLLQGMSSTAQNRSVFINSAIKLVREHCFDGIDIDWEYPVTTDKENYISLLKEFKEACVNESSTSELPKLLLTAAVPAGKQNIDPGYDVPNISRYMDFVMLMSYDFHGPWDSVTGMNSPLYARQNDTNAEFNVAAAANYWVQLGMPKSQLVVGVPTYGHGWTLLYPDTERGVGAPTNGSSPALQYSQAAGTVAYYEICEMIVNGASVYFDQQSQVPYLVANGNKWYSYENVNSVNIKMQWVRANGFAGAFVWDLDWDDFNAKCTNSTLGKYPLIGTIAHVLGRVDGISSQPSVAQMQNQTAVFSSLVPNFGVNVSIGTEGGGNCPFYYQQNNNYHHGKEEDNEYNKQMVINVDLKQI